MQEELVEEYEKAKSDLNSAFKQFKQAEMKCLMEYNSECTNKIDKIRLAYSSINRIRERDTSNCMQECFNLKEAKGDEAFYLCQQSCIKQAIPKIYEESRIIRDAASSS